MERNKVCCGEARHNKPQEDCRGINDSWEKPEEVLEAGFEEEDSGKESDETRDNQDETGGSTGTREERYEETAFGKGEDAKDTKKQRSDKFQHFVCDEAF